MDGGAAGLKRVVLTWCLVGGHTGLRDKRFDMRWCTVGCLGQHMVVPVGLSCRLATLVVVGCVWGLCCVRTV